MEIDKNECKFTHKDCNFQKLRTVVVGRIVADRIAAKFKDQLL